MSKVDWTRDLIIVLIEQYELQPCLYNTKHKFNSNKKARNDAMLKITQEIKNIDDRFELEDIKKKITNIRQQFWHENSKVQSSQKCGAEAEDIYQPSIWWYERLLFLAPHTKTRKSKSSLDLLTPSCEFGSEAQEESEDMIDSSCNSEIPDAPPTCTRKRKYKEIYQKSKLNNPSTSTIMKSDMQLYAEYLASELQDIGDEELLIDTKHNINNIVYEAKKKWLQIKKENQQRKDQFHFLPDNKINLGLK